MPMGRYLTLKGIVPKINLDTVPQNINLLLSEV